jgi:hypothetical protein
MRRTISKRTSELEDYNQEPQENNYNSGHKKEHLILLDDSRGGVRFLP